MIIKFLAYFSIFNLILLSLFLLLREKTRKSGIFNIAISMLIVAYTQWIVLLFYTGEIKQFQYLAYSEGIVFYLFAPLFYLYILKLIGDLPKKPIKYLVHLLPAIPGLIFYLVYITGSPEMRIYSIETKYCGVLPDVLLNITGVSIQIFYLILSVIKLNRFKKIICDNYSNFRQTEIQWIYFLLTAFILLSVSYLFFINFLNDKKQVDLITLMSLDFLFLAIFVKNLIYPFGIVPIVEGKSVLDDSEYLDNNQIVADNEIDKYENKNELPCNEPIEQLKQQNETNKQNKLTDTGVDCYYNKLVKYMVDEKPYLDPNLNLTKLSSSLNACSHNISLTINQKFQQNFFDFINSYRVEEAKKQLKNIKQNNLTIEGIAFDSGFNSKAAFYRAFKKNTQLTPSEFVKNNQ